MQQRQVSLEFRGGLVAFAQILLAGLEEDRVQFEHRFNFSEVSGKIAAVASRADLVKDFTQAVEVGLRRAGTFGRNETLRADKRTGFTRFRHETNVGQFWDAVHENDVCSYAPWGLKLYLNGHEWLKGQLAKEGIGFQELDNGFLSCQDPKRRH